jgi:DNA-binding NarL/FixJ family response regulator
VTPARILIADDHEVVRSGVRAIVESQAAWTVCGEARNGREAVLKAIELRPDVVVLDISMPELNGLEATRQIRRAGAARILILTVHDSERIAHDVIEAGAHGYVLKSDAGRKLVEAIRTLHDNGTFFTEQVQPVISGAPRLHAHAPDDGIVLTPRQREVLQLLAEGKSNKEIAALLGIATKTAETHRAGIMTTLDMHSLSDLVRYAIRNGIIEP